VQNLSVSRVHETFLYVFGIRINALVI